MGCLNHGHDMNIKDCPHSIVTVEHTTRGIGVAGKVYSLQAGKHCWEIDHYDLYYEKQGYVPGSCGPEYNTIDSVSFDEICNTHPHDENIKDCPDSVICRVREEGKEERHFAFE